MHFMFLVFFFRVMLSFFSILIECSGLKEEMDLEEAVEIIITTHDLWKCVLTASGKKKRAITERKTCCKSK